MFSQKLVVGFSLIELLVIVTIIGILLVVGIPSYHQYIIKAKMVEIFSLVDSHKIKLLEKIFNYHNNKESEHTILEAPNLLIDKLEHLINHQHKQYSIKITANMVNLGIKSIEYQPLIMEFIANTEDPAGLITWKCLFNKGYSDLMPKNCQETIIKF